MSAEASRDVSKAGNKKKAAAPIEEAPAKAAEAKAADAGAAGPAQEPGPQVESEGDRFETVMTYAPDAKLPAAVVLVWVCALIGLGTYCARLYFPELALWTSH